MNPFATNNGASGQNPTLPTVETFAREINSIIKARDADKLSSYLLLNPGTMPDSYLQMRQELQQVYGNKSLNIGAKVLESKIQKLLPATEESTEHAAYKQFTRFLLQYFEYLKDVSLDESKYVAAYELVTQMQQKANTALVHATLGHLLLPTTIACAQLLAYLAITLDKRPDLTRHLNISNSGGEDSTERISLAEQCVNNIRTALTTCCQDRLGGLDNNGVPTGKKAGIYKLANVMFKILLQCQNLLSAAFFLENIYQQSPPLSAYSKRDRVTYLYNLGRFHFHYGHFWRGHIALQAAYDECPTDEQTFKQRRLILIFLIASNICVGRFPAKTLFERSEAADLAERFLPLTNAIRKGDVAAFRAVLADDSPNYPFYAHYRIRLQLANIGELLLRRTLVRNIFKLHGVLPKPDAPANAAPTLTFTRLIPAIGPNSALVLSDPTNTLPLAPEYAGLSPAELQRYCRNPISDNARVISELIALVGQNLIHGYVSEKYGKLAIRGVSKGLPQGVTPAHVGFPAPYSVARATQKEGGDLVPGWKLEGAGAGAGMAGKVISLSGAGAVGA